MFNLTPADSVAVYFQSAARFILQISFGTNKVTVNHITAPSPQSFFFSENLKS